MLKHLNFLTPLTLLRSYILLSQGPDCIVPGSPFYSVFFPLFLLKGSNHGIRYRLAARPKRQNYCKQ